MDLIADGLLMAGALAAAFYCWVLSKRVKGLSDLDNGLGSAIASLSSQVNEMQTALRATQAVTGSTVSEMAEVVKRAEQASEQLKLMLATTQRENEDQPRPSARLRKFPKREKAEIQPKVEAVEDAPIPTKTAAAKLQKDVAQKLLDRDDDQRSRDELVEALQSILAASK